MAPEEEKGLVPADEGELEKPETALVASGEDDPAGEKAEPKADEPENENKKQQPWPVKRSGKGRRFLKRAAAVVAGTVVVSAVATELIFLIMFGRTKPIDKDEFPLKDWSAGKGFSWSELEFLSGGNLLRGYMVAPKDASSLLLIAHGMNASSRGFEPVVQFFAERGYAVMIFDGTASGKSEGERVVGLQQARYDIRAALDFLDSQPEYAAIPKAVLGHSAGAYGAATEAASPEVSAVVCVSGFDSPIGTMHQWARTYAHIFGDIELPFLAAHEYAALGSEANTSASAVLASNESAPALVVHGANDDAVPLSISLYSKLQEKGASGAELLLESVPGHDSHSDILVDDSGDVNIALLESIDSFLRSKL